LQGKVGIILEKDSIKINPFKVDNKPNETYLKQKVSSTKDFRESFIVPDSGEEESFDEGI
jgi:hypothetical protein